MATTYTLAPDGKMYFWNPTTGAPLAGGSVYTVSAGGAYPADAIATYQTSTGTANANPIVLNSAGYAVIYLTPGQSYKFIVNDASGTLVWTQDNIGAVPTSSQAVDITGTFGESVVASDAVYLSDGSGGKTAGQWYLTSATNGYSSSTAKEVGVALADTTATNSGTTRVGGLVPYSLASLTAGTAYYLDTTSGALTSTPPTNRRFVGIAQTPSTLVVNPSPGTGVFQGELLNYNEAKNALTIATNVLTVDLATGNNFTFTLNANITTMTLSNVPASGTLGSFTLLMTADGSSHTWTWFASTVKWPGGTAPTPTTTTGKVDIYSFLTVDGGTTWYGIAVGQAY